MTVELWGWVENKWHLIERNDVKRKSNFQVTICLLKFYLVKHERIDIFHFIIFTFFIILFSSIFEFNFFLFVLIILLENIYVLRIRKWQCKDVHTYSNPFIVCLWSERLLQMLVGFSSLAWFEFRVQSTSCQLVAGSPGSACQWQWSEMFIILFIFHSSGCYQSLLQLVEGDQILENIRFDPKSTSYIQWRTVYFPQFPIFHLSASTLDLFGNCPL